LVASVLIVTKPPLIIPLLLLSLKPLTLNVPPLLLVNITVPLVSVPPVTYVSVPLPRLTPVNNFLCDDTLGWWGYEGSTWVKLN